MLPRIVSDPRARSPRVYYNIIIYYYRKYLLITPHACTHTYTHTRIHTYTSIFSYTCATLYSLLLYTHMHAGQWILYIYVYIKWELTPCYWDSDVCLILYINIYIVCICVWNEFIFPMYFDILFANKPTGKLVRSDDF